MIGKPIMKKLIRRFFQSIIGMTAPKSNRENEAGLTLVETMIVIGVIIVFATSAILLLAPILGTSKLAAAKDQIGTFKQALEIYRLNCGTYPTAEQGLAALRQKPTLEPVPEGWKGPYIDKDVPKDPWGHDYKYVIPGPEGDPFGVISYGADGTEGGDGDNKDITSWQ
jgi:general secretion pathway protein G